MEGMCSIGRGAYVQDWKGCVGLEGLCSIGRGVAISTGALPRGHYALVSTMGNIAG